MLHQRSVLSEKQHARCGEGLGFITYSRGGHSGSSNSIISEPASGWTAYLSGLLHNETTAPRETTDDRHQPQLLLYDEGLEFDGGTPSYVEAAYVATRILQALPPIAEQRAYVQNHIQHLFLERCDALLSDRQKQAALKSSSNTLALPVHKMVPDLPFGLDYKILRSSSRETETIYLRIGFGIQNLPYHLEALMQVLEAAGALSDD